MPIEIKLLERGDERVLANVAPDVFDRGVDAELTSEFLNDPRHHLVVAIDGGAVVGFVSGVHYVHPDKPRELWINEVGVASTHRNSGVGKQLLTAMLEVARALGCREV